MAEVDPKFEFPHHDEVFRPKKNTERDQWLDGRVWKIYYGEDFQCHVKNFKSWMYKRALDLGLRVKIHDPKDGSLRLQAYGGDGRPAAPKMRIRT